MNKQSHQNWLTKLKGETLSENDIKYIKKNLYSMCSTSTPDQKSELHDALDLHDNYKLTQEHTEKGINYLRSKLLKSNGQPRNTKQVRDFTCDRIINIINNFSHFEFICFECVWVGYGNNHQYNPVWRTYDKDGNSFDYYMDINLNFQEW